MWTKQEKRKNFFLQPVKRFVRGDFKVTRLIHAEKQFFFLLLISITRFAFQWLPPGVLLPFTACTSCRDQLFLSDLSHNLDELVFITADFTCINRNQWTRKRRAWEQKMVIERHEREEDSSSHFHAHGLTCLRFNYFRVRNGGDKILPTKFSLIVAWWSVRGTRERLRELLSRCRSPNCRWPRLHGLTQPRHDS